VALATGCGGGTDAQALMPAVEGLRLDVALSDLAAQGVAEEDVEVVGGGTLGVLDESNWDVCEQRPAAGTAISNVRLIVDRVCGDEDTGTPTSSEDSSPATSTAETDTGEAGSDDDRSTSTGGAAAGFSPVEFAISAGGDIEDMRKDLRDSADALADGGLFRLSTNLVELTFNYGQLDALDPPEQVRADWEAAMASLDAALEAYRTSLDGESLDGVGQALAAIDAALTQLSAIAESVA